ncbi:MAG: beta-glucosidase [Parcubacteria group bacterium Gr01-1014_44]|nr:MAG: beta-glucosidase [Parcubacteria group bacterium Gr01-1014_44]
MESLKFPDGFLWGSATSSYQVEGGIENNDWAASAREGKVPPAGRATDHYHLYEKDFDLAKSLGHNAHRFSIEWARIEPEEGRFSEEAIEHYRKVLEALRARGMEPFVTLHHWTLPLWFAEKGGWLGKDAPKIFARYCEYVVSRLGDMAKFWITINEPEVFIAHGYLKGNWPPFKKSIFKYFKATKILLSSHLASYNIIKKINSELRVGIAKNNSYHWFWNFYFLNKIKNHQDFIGLNYYFHRRFFKNKNKEISDMGWEIYPEGICHVLKELKKYKKPVYITENGLADAKDQKREKFIKEHLQWAHRALQEGVDLRGYMYWSLLDNFEWAHGFEPRFGLVEVNYETLERRIRPSAWEYAKICKANQLEVD